MVGYITERFDHTAVPYKPSSPTQESVIKCTMIINLILPFFYKLQEGPLVLNDPPMVQW